MEQAHWNELMQKHNIHLDLRLAPSSTSSPTSGNSPLSPQGATGPEASSPQDSVLSARAHIDTVQTYLQKLTRIPELTRSPLVSAFLDATGEQVCLLQKKKKIFFFRFKAR